MSKTQPQAVQQDSDLIIKGFTRERASQLQARGVPGFDLLSRHAKPINVHNCLVRIEQDLGYSSLPTKVISTTRQMRALKSVLEHPLNGSYVMGISSFPSDARAKHLAQYIMSTAIDAWGKHHKAGRGLPLWHRVYGSLGDSLRDNKNQQELPSMLIISNVNDSATPQKLEKVRDLLEKFSDIPRIVVSGGYPLCNLFASRLFTPLKSVLFLGPDNRVQDLDHK